MDSLPQIICKKCNAPRARDDFYDKANQKHLPPEIRRKERSCKECKKAYKDRANELRRIRLKGKKRTAERRKYQLKRHYGMSIADYEMMRNTQSGVCAICGKPETWTNKYGLNPLSVDHNHTTGKVRGLLCRHCNLFLGRCNNDTTFLRSAITYLEK